MPEREIKNQDVAFSLLRRELEHVTNESERMAVLERLVALEPRGDQAQRLKARYKSEIEMLRRKARSRGTHSDSPYDGLLFERQVAIVGEPNSGKSTLLHLLTGAPAAVSPAPFTTYRPETGMLDLRDVLFQVVEVPALFRDEDNPRKRHFLRSVDLLCIAARTEEDARATLACLEDHLVVVVGHYLPGPEHKYRPKDEVLEKPGFIAAWEPFSHALPVALATDARAVGDLLYRLFGILRVYSVQHEVVEGRPLVFAAGGASSPSGDSTAEVTVRDFAERLDRRNLRRFTRARLRSDHAAFDGQVVGLDHPLHDGDRVTLLP